MIDFPAVARVVRKVVTLPQVCVGAPADYVYVEQIRLLSKFEHRLSLAFEVGGMSKEAAATAALSFLAQCVSRNAS